MPVRKIKTTIVESVAHNCRKKKTQLYSFRLTYVERKADAETSLCGQPFKMKYMKKYVCLAASAALLMACNEKPGYEIAGTVSAPAADGKYVYLYTYPYNEENAPLDSALVQNGSFLLKGTAQSPALRVLVWPDEEKPRTGIFMLENGKLKAEINDHAYVEGTPENDVYSGLKKEIDALNVQTKALAADLKSEDKAVVAAAESKYDELDQAITAKSKAYILANPDKQTAAVAFYNMRYNLDEDAQNEIVAKADSAFKAVPGIDKMIAHLEVLKKVAVGKPFTDFEMADAQGKLHKLSDYVGKGKVVLVDFWASWCPPCRREMPNLVAAYKQYKNKGFEIVGISLDSKADAWAKGVKDLGITWPQLSDLQGWKNAGAALYGVNSIPHTLLVDKDGTIIAKNLHGEALDAKLKEVLN